MMAAEVPLDRVVAVVGTLVDGRRKWGSGFLVSPTRVLTAWHCTVDDATTSRPLTKIRVLRHSSEGWEGAPAVRVAYAKRRTPGSRFDWGVDAAVLEVANPPWGATDWESPGFARVDRTGSGVLADCVVVGYPMYMLTEGLELDTGSVRGFIRVEQGAASGYMTLHDQSVHGLKIPHYVSPDQRATGSPWGGLSGSAVFHRGRILGHVVQHRPHQGGSQLTVVAAGEIAVRAEEAPESGSGLVARALGIPPVAQLPSAPIEGSAIWAEALEWGSLDNGAPQQVAEVTHLSAFGVHSAVLDHLDYVPRELDAELRKALDVVVASRRMLLVSGHSAAGKTRSAAQAVRSHQATRGLRFLKPRVDGGLARLVDSGIPMVNALVWLEDLDKYLAAGLDIDLVSRLQRDPDGPLLVATIRTSQLAARRQSIDPSGDFLKSPEATIEVVVPVAMTPAEIARLSAQQSVEPELIAELRRGVGLGEWLVAGPRLIARLQGATEVQAAIASTVFGWYRSGVGQPFPIDLCRALWTRHLPPPAQALLLNRTPEEQEGYFQSGLRWLTSPVEDLARELHEQSLATEVRSSLIAHDFVIDHILLDPNATPVSDEVWAAATQTALGHATTSEQDAALWSIGVAGFFQGAAAPALEAWRILADRGYLDALVNEAPMLMLLGRPDDAIASCDFILQEYGHQPDPETREQVAMALSNKVAALGVLKRPADLVKVADSIAARYGQDEDPRLREQVARALANKAAALEELKQQDEAIRILHALAQTYGEDLDPATREVVAASLVRGASLLDEAGRADEALAALELVAAEYGEDASLYTQGQVAASMVHRAALLDALGRRDEANSVRDQLIDNHALDEAFETRVHIASALVQKADALSERAHHEGAASAYDQLILRFGDDPRGEMRSRVATARVNRAVELGRLGRTSEALAACDDVLRQYWGVAGSEARIWVATALANKCFALEKLGRHVEHLAALDRLIDEFRQDPTPKIRIRVADALASKVEALRGQGELAEAERVHAALVTDFGTDQNPEIRRSVAAAQANRAGHISQPDEAIREYDLILSQYGLDHGDGMRAVLVTVLLNKALRLSALGRVLDELAVYDGIIAEFSRDAATEVLETVATAAAYLAITLGQLDRPTEALTVCEHVIAAYGEASAGLNMGPCARALHTKVVALAQLQRAGEIPATCDALLAAYGTSTDPTSRRLIIEALCIALTALTDFGQSGDVRRFIGVVKEILVSDSDLDTRKQLLSSLVTMAHDLAHREQPPEEVVAFLDWAISAFGDDPSPGVPEPSS